MDAKKMVATRKSTQPIKVYCLPDERSDIEALAAASGHSASTYLRLVGLGYRVEGIIDVEQVRVNGDLGRLGGLLKLWLANDARVAMFKPGTIIAMLSKIEATQDVMSHIMESVIRQRAKS